MTKEWSIEIVNFMTPGTGVLVLGHGSTYKLYSGNALMYVFL